MPRPRNPTGVLQLSGAFRKDPQRLAARAHEPQFMKGLGEPPDWLDDRREHPERIAEIVRRFEGAPRTSWKPIKGQRGDVVHYGSRPAVDVVDYRCNEAVLRCERRSSTRLLREQRAQAHDPFVQFGASLGRGQWLICLRYRVLEVLPNNRICGRLW